MVAMDRSMTIVETGSSAGRAAMPNAPPTAPVHATSNRWSPFLAQVAGQPNLLSSPRAQDSRACLSHVSRHPRPLGRVLTLLASRSEGGPLKWPAIDIYPTPSRARAGVGEV